MSSTVTKKEPFLQRLARGPLIADGAMGTELYSRGRKTFDQCLDEMNILDPGLVLQIHLEYLQAGAEILETNTFGANRLRLESHGLSSRVSDLNRRGVELAQKANRLTNALAYVAGAIGPTGKLLAPIGSLTKPQARENFNEQVESLVESGVDLLILESFSSLIELEEAVRAVRASCDLPIIAQMTFTDEGNSLHGETPVQAAQRLRELGVDVVGANCSVGSESMVATMEQITEAVEGPLAAQPNAGFPHYVGGRNIYMASPSYMAGHAQRMITMGISVIGGCCGTTPAHTAALREAVATSTEPPASRNIKTTPVALEKGGLETSTTEVEPTLLARKLGKKFVVTLEVDPPRGFDVGPILERLVPLLGTGLIDVVNIADSPRAQGRMSALATSVLIQDRLGLETIMHLATRHRNLLALHSELLGAQGLGIRNLFVVRGDPPALGDYPEAGGLSDVTPSGLLRLMEGFNSGIGSLGQPLERPTSFVMGAALNLGSSDINTEMNLMERKVQAGADFFMTQPIYDPEILEHWRKRIGMFPKPVLLGILPLRSLRHAEYLHNEVPGIVVPQEARERLGKARSSESDVGLEIAREILLAGAPYVGGAYVMPPFNRYHVLADLFEGLESSIPGLQRI